jgi:hypothetical protein
MSAKIKSLRLVTAVMLMYLNGFAANYQVADTSFLDITGIYRVSVPYISNDVQNFQVAIIPPDSIGKKRIVWNDNQRQFTKETEEEFEKELINCSQGKDSTYAHILIIHKKNYCRKSGYSDGGMGKLYDVNYISFTRKDKLIVIEFAVIWRYCPHGYEGDGLKKCESEEQEKKIRVDEFIDQLVGKLAFKNAY